MSAAPSSPRLMGILNCTPDSFHAGGRSMDARAAIDHGLRLVHEGADIVDVGGESTRPGATRVPADEQVRRVVPVIEGLRAAGVGTISVDTTLSQVAERALATGASMVNDVSAGTEDARLMQVAAAAGAELVLMHRLVVPGDDRYSDRYEREPQYGDVVSEVGAWLAERLQAAAHAGVSHERVLIDPGFGFGKSVAQNFEMLRRLGEFAGHRVLVGLSRKSFLGAVAGAPEPADRLPATLAAAMLAMRAGASVLRVHDVAAHAQVRAVFR
ncbi:MAG: dihydropteroate synthase, partial [Planctomycetota bacterium]